MNVILVKVVRHHVGNPFKPNITYCDEIFSKSGYISAYLCLMYLSLLFLHTVQGLLAHLSFIDLREL